MATSDFTTTQHKHQSSKEKMLALFKGECCSFPRTVTFPTMSSAVCYCAECGTRYERHHWSFPPDFEWELYGESEIPPLYQEFVIDLNGACHPAFRRAVSNG